MVTIRDAMGDDHSILQVVLALAFNWRNGRVGLTGEQLMVRSDISHYISGWPRTGDVGVVAEIGRPTGAAWWRYFTAGDPGYGFVDSQTPEVTIGVIREHRGVGVGIELLDALMGKATEGQLPALSLSVEPENYAIELYASKGFEVVGSVGGSLTMV